MITILYKKLHPDAKAPAKAHEGDAGWDVTATDVKFETGVTTLEGCAVIYSTGLAFAIPKGYWMMAAPRSSVYKQGMFMANSVGVIDACYRGEVKGVFYLHDNGDDHKAYDKGDRIFQLIPMPCRTDEVEFKEVDELPESWDGRGEGGFGSSDATWNETRSLPVANEHDSVNHPSHYCGFSNGAEVIDISENLSFNLGNVVKYCSRSGKKHEEGMDDRDKAIEDLEKARYYLDREISRLKEELRK